MASPLDPRSPHAQAIADLFTTTFFVCGAIFAIVAGLIGYAVFKFRDREGATASQTEGHKRLELAWTAAPAAIVTWLFVLTMRAMNASDPPPDREPDLVVIAHQWWWEVRYASGAVTANELHIPTGKPLVVAIESADVIHDFWVPDLGRKIDAVPGRRVNIWLEADQAGTYLGTCAEYCGVQHAWMRLMVVAESPEAFAAWDKHTREPAPAAATESEARGAKLFTSMTCVKCHAITGNGEGARAAPDLTHLADRKTLGSGVVENNPTELARWLKHPQDLKRGCHMPDVQLSDTQVADFVAYFGALK